MFFKSLPLLIVLTAWPALADGPKSVDGETLRKQAAAELKKKDADGDGALTLEEFLAHAPDTDRLDRTRRFLLFDFDGDRMLNADEFYTSSVPIDDRGDVPDPILQAEQAALAKWELIFTAADRDGDGALSRDEWPAKRMAAEIPDLADVTFSLWDHDGDHKIDRADSRRLFQVAYGLTQFDGRPLRTAAGRVFSWYYFRNLDGDGNDVVSRDEFVSRHHAGKQNAAIFATLDANADGQLTDRETWSLLWHDTITQFLNYDRDRDGYLSPDEMEAIGWGVAIARQCVSAFDDDHDGGLSFREFRQTTFANQASAWSLRQDKDQDGRLSWAEFYTERSPLLIAQSRFMFDHFDRNHDGFLSAWEFTIEGDRFQRKILAFVEPLDRCLPLEVEFAQHVCDLTDEQTDALERAGWFAIERLTGKIAGAMRKSTTRVAVDGGVRLAQIQRVPHLLVRRELVHALQPGSADGIVPLAPPPSPDIWKKLDAECAAAMKRQRLAAIGAHVALLDEALLLTDRQRKDLRNSLANDTSDAWWNAARPRVILDHAFEALLTSLGGLALSDVVVPEADLTKCLTSAQLATFKELQQARPQEVLVVQQAAPRQVVPEVKAPAAPGNKVGVLAPRVAPAGAGMLAGQVALARVIKRVVGRRLPAEDQERCFAGYVQRRLDDIDTACGLSATQREKLSLAAKLDVARWRDRPALPSGEKLAEGEELVVRQAMILGGLPRVTWTIFNDSRSHFQKTLHSQLLADQQQKLLAADRARMDFRRQALVEAMVISFETAASLTAEQCDSLFTEFKAELPDLNPATTDWPLDGLLRILQAPSERLRAIVHETQWERFERQRGMIAEALRQYELRKSGEASVGNGLPSGPRGVP